VSAWEIVGETGRMVAVVVEGGFAAAGEIFSGELVLWRLDIVLTFGVPWGASNFVRHA
jgi:hypothetical protein